MWVHPATWDKGEVGASAPRVTSQTRKIMLKILQARFQQYVNQEIPDGQTGFRKGRGPRDQTANIHWIIKM